LLYLSWPVLAIAVIVFVSPFLRFPVCPVLLLLYVLRAVNSWNRTEPQYERLTINKDDGDDESEPFAFVAFNQYSAGEREPYQLKML
jgi:hypothetical protein